MTYSNSFRVFDRIKRVIFVCVLLAAIDNNNSNNSSYPVTDFAYDNDSPQIKFDVFVSFRGTDIRQDFLSHLIEAFSQRHINAFVDNKVVRGDGMSEALIRAIEGSSISLIIFSQDYASSHWCLSELVKIVECRKKNGQIVLPVFYKVDPAHVRHQKGTYEHAFAKHQIRYSLTTMQIWRTALTEAANLAGFHSSTFRDEAEFIKEIVKCVLSRLNQVQQGKAKGLVGVGKRIAHVESLLQSEEPDVRIMGIWGMGGIGKTTIAQEVYDKLCFEYEGCCFLANIREESGRLGMISLKKKLFSTLLGGEDLKIDTPNGLPQYIERRLRRMKVLIILDDVNDSDQLEVLAGTHDWFGSGSRIIITTRDKQVLAREFASIYEVEALNFDESLRLFNLNAFKQNHLESEYHELSKKVVNYAKGIPLVLKVLGHLLHGKDKETWESQLERLKKVQNKKVHDIIKLSYNDLDRDEKKIFLDIACFFDGLNLKVKHMNFLLKDHDYSVVAGLERLKDKALISVSQENGVSMHNIIQETAWQIAREESIDNPRSQIRLLDPEDIYHVLNYNKGDEAIRSIVINLSRIKQLQLNPQVFARMSKLHFLDFYSKGSCSCLRDQGGLYLPQGLESLSNELRYLRWTHYPLESLPSKFSAENLVELNLPNSRLKKLWQEAPEDLVNLRVLILHSSTRLKELPNFSKATNLKVIDLRFCVRLTSVHSSIFSLRNLEKLYLGGCLSLRSLRSNVHLDSLRYLSLYGCMSLKDFSVTSKNMVKLNLELTGIKRLPSSFGLQSNLQKLRLAYTYIDHLPTSIKHLTRLRHLDLRYCRQLRTLPELPASLETLDARGCISLETVTFPSTAGEQLKENKKRVAFWNCLKLDEPSLTAIELNAQINMMKFAHQHFSLFGDAQSTYVYPGSKVPEWLVHKTTHDDFVIIDLSSVLSPHSSHIGFIFGFVVPEVPFGGSALEFKISISGEGSHINVYMDRPRHRITSDHVYLMYDQACSRYLNGRAKHEPRLKIKVALASRTLTSKYVPLKLRAFGISAINTTDFLSFVQKVKFGDNVPNVPILSRFFCTFCIVVFVGTFNICIRRLV
ncbi:disease resistance protein RML1A [Vigna radiata var. radiata]|uniref:Disease resistance protein RML1A n=1 Tax=Vigna radiata var. radiata TaxID=3916 RepID=A0A1S3VAF0_VIGRR|nr:disease resistance protein RML1A [Vigna radiata var. radiata]XP_022641989.1 disease resistance protein RML1A [Vigna radiata var. radiata]XP_022641990.1 disease resistance protein RML1A [Vigna radiata var. radiata]XP_022641991.1 disease resistance protein RML1A [Vigna radiata var. radiata]XP_022641992.1 disease resistance protein RML1A [Vigna radiata var. radiata]XP_022641993.1 disease resistance protein RML1A [Vigna radiata var. radiata]XP_022641994.1 disease resistance protein RML1A [Vign